MMTDPASTWRELREGLAAALDRAGVLEYQISGIDWSLADLWDYSDAASRAVLAFKEADGPDQVDKAFIDLQLAVRNLDWNVYRFTRAISDLDQSLGAVLGYEPDMDTVSDVAHEIADWWPEDETRGAVASAIHELRSISPALMDELRGLGATVPLSEQTRSNLNKQLESVERAAGHLRNLIER